MRDIRICLAAATFCIATVTPGQEQDRNSRIHGNVRIQFISPNLVRFEEKGPKGFEDRPTFHIQDRSGPGDIVPIIQSVTSIWIATNWMIETGNTGARNLASIKYSLVKSTPEWIPLPTKLENSKWLPAPGDRPQVWWFADTPRIAKTATGWDTTNDAPDVYLFFPKGDYKQLRKDLLKLTGKIPMPPLYTFGFWDSRYYPYSEQTALQQIDEYKKRGFPIDLLVIDTDWRKGGSHGYDADPKHFPDLPGFLKKAHDKDVKVMFNDHPEPQAESAFDPKEVDYRKQGLTRHLKDGLDVWWYDRNWHVGLKEPLPGLRKEVWGMDLYQDITQRANPNQRPLIMANVDGIDNGYRNSPPNVAAHRYPVQWTGDTLARWDFLQKGIENAVYEGVHGLNPYVNEDLGGHAGKPSRELYIRFLQYGCFSPVTRVHCTLGQRREPWEFGPEAERISREYIKMRYRLLPYIYSAAYEAHQTGEPILRRLDLAYPGFEVAKRDDQYLFGPSILVAPIYASGIEEPLPAELVHTPTGEPGLKGEYFPNPDMIGAPALVRTDKDINFNWGTNPPAQGMRDDNYRVRWTGTLGPIPQGKPRKLWTTTDDGVRVWLDGKLVIDAWLPQDSVTNESSVLLHPGKTYDIKIEYFEKGGNAVMMAGFAKTGEDAIATRKVWIPPGTWIDLWKGEEVEGPKEIECYAKLQQMPMWVEKGSLLPMIHDPANAETSDWSTIVLDFYPWRRGNRVLLYEDDRTTNGYLNGQFRTTKIFSGLGLRGDAGIGVEPIEGNLQSGPRTRNWVIRFHISPDWKNPQLTVRRAQYRVRRIKKHAGMPLSTEASPTDDVLEVTILNQPIDRAFQADIRPIIGPLRR